jgi:polysaccharide biosynthesis protein PelF
LRICLILEGCYPYVRGGVSSWAHNYIKALPQHEFVLWTIGAAEEKRGKFKYELPNNVSEIHEVFLDSAHKLRARKNHRFVFTPMEAEQIKRMLNTRDPDWKLLFECYNKKCRNPVAFMMSEQFLQILKEICEKQFPFARFSDLFYTIRSMFLPLIYLMGQPVPEADIYHATAAGYSGIMGAMGAWRYNKPYVLTEHGIYSREREEEIIRSKWILPYFKDMWISLFYMLSHCAYSYADLVTSLYEHAKDKQVELGCSPDKCVVVNNGIFCESFIGIPTKKANGYIDIGAIVRIAPIKDIKTMIYSFAELKHTIPNARLHILGDVDDEDYYHECLTLVNHLDVHDVLFVGNTDVKVYLQKLDFSILTSISEAQPLAIIESFAARRPCIATDVGCCRELIEGGQDDEQGMAGICIPPMHRPSLTAAMERLCRSAELRESMGEVGKQRALRLFTHQKMMQSYQNVYRRAQEKWQG